MTADVVTAVLNVLTVALGAPLLDAVRAMTYAELQTMFDATNPPGAWYYKTGYLDGRAVHGDRFVDVLLDHCDFPSPSPMSRIFIEHLGGAMGRVPPDATAFVHRDALFDAQYTTTWPAGAAAAAVARQHAWQQSFWQSMRPYASGQAYQNYVDPALANWRQAYYGANLARLTQVKAKYDPNRVFRFPQAI